MVNLEEVFSFLSETDSVPMLQAVMTAAQNRLNFVQTYGGGGGFGRGRGRGRGRGPQPAAPGRGAASMGQHTAGPQEKAFQAWRAKNKDVDLSTFTDVNDAVVQRYVQFRKEQAERISAKLSYPQLSNELRRQLGDPTVPPVAPEPDAAAPAVAGEASQAGASGGTGRAATAGGTSGSKRKATTEPQLDVASHLEALEKSIAEVKAEIAELEKRRDSAMGEAPDEGLAAQLTSKMGTLALLERLTRTAGKQPAA